jgi:hypothetical protein
MFLGGKGDNAFAREPSLVAQNPRLTGYIPKATRRGRCAAPGTMPAPSLRMRTRWFRSSYDREYERHTHPERDDPIPQWSVTELLEDGTEYEPNPTSGYDPIHDRDMRFSAGDWGELLRDPV